MPRGFAVLLSLLLLFSMGASIAEENDHLTPVEQDLFWLNQQELENRSLTSRQIQALNQELIIDMGTEEVPARRNGRRVNTITRNQAAEVLRSLQANPVASTNALPTYDPTRQIGFCFGRATYVHLELLRRGVQKESIRKVFIVGPMIQNYRYHVATMVRGQNGEWLVIDPEVFQVVTLQEWYNTMWRWSADQKMRMFVTDAKKFGPSNPTYPRRAVQDPFYNQFFTNLFSYFQQNPIPDDQSFKTEAEYVPTTRGGVGAFCARVFKAVTGRR